MVAAGLGQGGSDVGLAAGGSGRSAPAVVLAAGDELSGVADGLLVAEIGVLLVDGQANLRVRERGQLGIDVPFTACTAAPVR